MEDIRINDDVWLYEGETLAEGVKPCPFCGNAFIKTKTRERYADSVAHGFSFECQKCGTEMWYIPDIHEKKDYDTVLYGLTKQWNRRANA